jgi:hypothetical protein
MAQVKRQMIHPDVNIPTPDLNIPALATGTFKKSIPENQIHQDKPDSIPLKRTENKRTVRTGRKSAITIAVATSI